MPYEKINNLIKYHTITQSSDAIQNFYGKPCFMVTIDNDNNLDEIYNVLKEAYKLQN